MRNLILGFALALGLQFSCPAAFAGGLITLQGKLISITQGEYLIETPRFIYFLDRKIVQGDAARLMGRTEAKVNIQVPIEAIVFIKPVPVKKNVSQR